MPAQRPIHRVDVKNFLSLKSVSLEMRPLNVLVGPNGSGKTNFLKIFDFIGEIAEQDLVPAIDKFGGIKGLIFQGAEKRRQVSLSIKGSITKYANPPALDEYTLYFEPAEWAYRPRQHQERHRDIVIRREEFKFKRVKGPGRRITLSESELAIFDRSSKRRLDNEEISSSTSGLALLRRLGKRYEADQVEEIAQLFETLRLIDIDVPQARRQSPAGDASRLRHDGSNIASFLLRLMNDEPDAFQDIEDDVAFVLPTFEKFVLEKAGGGDEYVHILVKEKPFDEPIPLDRISFGTVRAIVLFTMLHDPDPPRLTCVEEIDHGFHPHALDRLVDRMRAATQRTQMIVATHSPALVNRLRTDELVMFSRDESDGSTKVARPNFSHVEKMKKEIGYELGELWFSGLLMD